MLLLIGKNGDEDVDDDDFEDDSGDDKTESDSEMEIDDISNNEVCSADFVSFPPSS